MTDLIVPGFKVIIPNAVYTKPLDAVNSTDQKVRMLTYQRFNFPTTQEMLDLSARAAADYLSGKKTINSMDVAKYSSGIPPNFIRPLIEAIAKKEKNALSIVAREYEGFQNKTGANLIRVRTGVVPEKAYMNDDFPQDSPIAYSHLIPSSGSNQWVGANIFLTDDGMLPDIDTIRTLLKHRVIKSDILEVTAMPREYRLAEMEIDRVYSLFTKASHISKVPDISEAVLNGEFELTIRDTFASLMNGISHKLAQAIGPSLEVMVASVDGAGKIETHYPPCSIIPDSRTNVRKDNGEQGEEMSFGA